MTRRIVLGALIAAGALSMAASAFQQPAARGRQGGPGGAQQAPPSADALMVDKLKDNLYVLRGGGGNTAAFITATGVVLVDTKLPGWGQPLIDKVKTLTGKPITTIINTHTHFDHVSGNVAFPASVEIVTHENTKRYMEEANPVYGVQTGPQQNLFKENGGRGMPTRTFKDKMTLGRGNDRIDLFYFGRAHTGGDAYVVFPALRVAHVGDTFPNKGLPIMDRNNGGSGVAFPGTLGKAAAALAGSVDTLITGHGGQMTISELKEYSAFTGDFVAFVQQAKKSGRTVDDVVSTWKTPAKYTGYASPQENQIRNDAQVVWDETK